jgi:hypothetical protein
MSLDVQVIPLDIQSARATSESFTFGWLVEGIFALIIWCFVGVGDAYLYLDFSRSSGVAFYKIHVAWHA